MDDRGYALWNGGAMAHYLAEASADDMLTEAKGCRVRDAGGRWYLDARAGLWNVSLGYDHQRVRDAVERQLRRLPVANIIRYGRPSDIAVEYANALADALPGDLRRIRFTSTGSQAVEVAVMMSRFVRRAEGRPDRTAIFGMFRAFHGLGAAPSVVSGEPYLHYSCGPLMPDTRHVHGPWEAPADELERAILDFEPQRVTAVVVEPVVGNGGAVLSPEYLSGLAAFCAEHDIHLIFDEVTTGMGRVGAMTRAEQVGVVPDFMTLGKGITSGYVPLAAVAVHERIYRSLFDIPPYEPFVLGSTNDGSPLAMAAGKAVLDVLLEGEVLGNVAAQSERLERGLRGLRDRFPCVAAVQGVGLMWGLTLAEPGGEPWKAGRLKDLRQAVERRGVLLSNVDEGHAMMVMPPFVITADEVDEIVDALGGGIEEVASR